MSLSFRFRAATGAVVFFCVASIGVVSAAPRVSDIIKSRQEKLRDMGASLKGISDELKKRNPDWDAIILPSAEALHSRGSYLLNWFPKGSGPETGLKTYALPGIWQKPDDFTKVGKAMMAATAKLQQVAATRDAGALKVEVIAAGKSCKACHDSYRSPDYEKENED
jgi:cytochrome c556